jgi:hypothetical protein
MSKLSLRYRRLHPKGWHRVIPPARHKTGPLSCSPLAEVSTPLAPSSCMTDGMCERAKKKKLDVALCVASRDMGHVTTLHGSGFRGVRTVPGASPPLISCLVGRNLSPLTKSRR